MADGPKLYVNLKQNKGKQMQLNTSPKMAGGPRRYIKPETK